MAFGMARSLVLWAAGALAAASSLGPASADALMLAAEDGTPVVEGIVLLPSGKPAAGAHVSLAGYTHRAFGNKRGWCAHEQFAVTDANGRFRYAERDGFSLGGELRLGLWARTADGKLGTVRDVRRAGSFSLVLGPAKTLEIEPRRVPSMPVTSSADVALLQVKTATGTLRTRVGMSSGSSLSFGGVPPGSFVVEVQAWCGPDAPCAGAIARGRIDADRGIAAPPVLLEIAPYGVAEGVALDPSTRAPLAGAPIACDDGPCAWDTDGFWPAAHTGPDGRYRITGLAPGTHVLRFGDRVTAAVAVAPAAPPRAAPADGPAIAR